MPGPIEVVIIALIACAVAVGAYFLIRSVAKKQ